jgi:uncharacterized membrane protein
VRPPFAPLPLLAFLFLLGALLAIVQLGAVTIAFDRLGLSPGAAFLLLLSALLGGTVNLPLFTVVSERAPEVPPLPAPWRGLLRFPMPEFTGKTLIAVNVGGCVIPVAFSLYLLVRSALPFWQVLLAVAVMTALSRLASRPVPGLGIGMPVLVAPLGAAATALVLGGEQSAPLAYICGTLGVLIGADLLRLNDIRRLGTPFAAIGGAGSFDGIFLTGIIAVLLA